MSDAYDPELRRLARDAAGRLGIELGEGVYAAWLGPQFETPAEIRFMRAVGGDLAGMSTVPEVIAARHMGIRCLGISVVTNMAAGVLPEKIDHERGARGGRPRGGLAHGASARARSYTLLVKLRDLPSVDELLRDERLAAEPHELAVAAARLALERAREEIRAGRTRATSWRWPCRSWRELGDRRSAGC